MIIENALAHYYPQVQHAQRQLTADADAGFAPGPQLPALTSAVRAYLATSTLAHVELADYRGRRLSYLDLTRNPATGTTKTFASLVIVARAADFVRRTGQRVTIVTASSGNKAVALRDAVLRAVKGGLVGPDQLNIVAIVPAGAAYKVRDSELSTDPDLRRRNPVAVYGGSAPAAVRTIARSAVEDDRALLESTAATNVWYTLTPENYLAADAVRAYAEDEFFPPRPGRVRLHAHSVSSAYGLLGHAYGRELLGHPPARGEPGYLLVQHLGAPDMVLGLHRDGSGGSGRPPHYRWDRALGLHRQDEDPRFPGVTFDPEEVLDPTFYARNAPTTPRMTALVHAGGGGGVVVSMAECLQRFGQVRSLLRDAGIAVPANPTLVQEWAVVMVVTGVLNALDRGLVDADEIVLHGSGTYDRTQFAPVGRRDLRRADTGGDLREVIIDASKP